MRRNVQESEEGKRSSVWWDSRKSSMLLSGKLRIRKDLTNKTDPAGSNRKDACSVIAN